MQAARENHRQDLHSHLQFFGANKGLLAEPRIIADRQILCRYRPGKKRETEVAYPNRPPDRRGKFGLELRAKTIDVHPKGQRNHRRYNHRANNPDDLQPALHKRRPLPQTKGLRWQGLACREPGIPGPPGGATQAAYS